MPIIVVDLDGTLADDTRRRVHLPNWDQYFDGVLNDPVNAPLGDILTTLQCKILTGRPEWLREVTELWLKKHRIRYTELIMRPEGDRRPAEVFKAGILDAWLADPFYAPSNFLFFEDNDKCIVEFVQRGIAVMKPFWGLS